MAGGDDEVARESLPLPAEHPFMRELLTVGLTEKEFASLRGILSDRGSISLNETAAVQTAHGLSGQ